MLLVSAVMPTRGRCELAAMALECFRSQTYPEKEFVILDDADCPSFPSGVNLEGVRYHLADRRMQIPEKRNAVNTLARGELIMHFDSDDWSAPERMAEQVERFLRLKRAVIGYSAMLFYDARQEMVADFRRAADSFALGTSLCYTQAFWLAHPFAARTHAGHGATGSDNHFVETARKAHELSAIDCNGLMVARNHEGQTNNRRELYKLGKVRPAAELLPAAFIATLPQVVGA